MYPRLCCFDDSQLCESKIMPTKETQKKSNEKNFNLNSLYLLLEVS